MEDIIMFGIVQQDTRLTAVLRRITEAGGTLNPDKWKFSQCKLKFLGQIIYAQWIQADSDKMSTICDMEQPRIILEC